MADIAKINVNDFDYDIKDASAREDINEIKEDLVSNEYKGNAYFRINSKELISKDINFKGVIESNSNNIHLLFFYLF